MLNNRRKKAFTLVELLVVVLIIGILAAIALPQYQKAAERAKVAEALIVLKTVVRAAEAYYLANGTWPTKFDELTVDIPWTGNQKGFTTVTDTRSNGDWSLQVYFTSTDSGQMHSIMLTRLRGKYKGAYIFWHFIASLHPGTTLHARCSEYNGDGKLLSFSGNTGDYCSKILHAKSVPNSTAYRIEF